MISFFIHTLEFIRKELHSIQKYGKISFKHCNSFCTNLASEILLQKLQTPSESIALHDQAQAQPDKSKIYTLKNDSATSPVPELLTQNAMKRKLCNSSKNDSPSSILDLRQSKPVKSKLCVTAGKNDFGSCTFKSCEKKFLTLLKVQRNLYFTVVLVKIFPRANLKHIETFVWPVYM